jgi:hypothetical protein
MARLHQRGLSRSKSALHSVSAWVCGLKMCVGLKSVEDKSNDIPHSTLGSWNVRNVRNAPNL